MRTCSVCRRFNPSAGPHCPRDGARTNDGPPPEFAAGSKVFGRFEIGEPIARGATGTVYRARDEAGSQVALKVVHSALTQSAIDRSRIKRELNKAASVVHPRIAHVREVGETEARLFLIREFVEGDAVASLLHRDGPFDVARCARLTHALASALAEAHKVGVLHRDLNPRHVIVLPDGLPMLIDVSLAAPLPGGIGGKPAVGSLASLAPEQAAGRLVTLRADLYALGLLLHEMLTGAAPALSADPATAIAERAAAEPMPAPEGVPEEIALLLGQLLANDPKDRPFGARQVEKVLSKFALRAAPRPTTAPLRSGLRGSAETTAPYPELATQPTVIPITLPPTTRTVTSPGLDAAGALSDTVEPRSRIPTPASEVSRTRKTHTTLVGVALPTAPDASQEVRQAWARNLLGLPTEATPPPPRPMTLPIASAVAFPSPDTDRTIADRVAAPAEAAAAPAEAAAAPGEAAAAPPPSAASLLLDLHDADTERHPVSVVDEQELSYRDVEPVTGAPRPSLADLEAAARALATPEPTPVPRVSAPAATLEAAARALASRVSEITPAPGAPAPTLEGQPVSAAAAPAVWSVHEDDELPAEVGAMRRSPRTLVIAGACGLGVVLVVAVAAAVMGGSETSAPAHEAAPPAAGHATSAKAPPVSRPPAAAPVPTPAPAPTPPTPPAGSPSQVAAAPAPAPEGETPVAAAPAAPEATPEAAPAAPAPPPPAADTDGRTTEKIIKSGRSAIRRRRWPQARAEFALVLRRDPRSLDAALGLAQVAMAQHDFDEAVAKFRLATDLRPTSATFQDYLGNALHASGEREAAAAAWRRALELDPGNLEARQRLGLARRAPRRPHGRAAPARPAPAKARRGQMLRRNPY